MSLFLQVYVYVLRTLYCVLHKAVGKELVFCFFGCHAISFGLLPIWPLSIHLRVLLTHPQAHLKFPQLSPSPCCFGVTLCMLSH